MFLMKMIKTSIIPSHALRDEGFSFHYVEASDEIAIMNFRPFSFLSPMNVKISHKEGPKFGQLMALP